MDKVTFKRIQKLMKLAKEQDALADAAIFKDEPAYNKHSAEAARLRQLAREVRQAWNERN